MSLKLMCLCLSKFEVFRFGRGIFKLSFSKSTLLTGVHRKWKANNFYLNISLHGYSYNSNSWKQTGGKRSLKISIFYCESTIFMEWYKKVFQLHLTKCNYNNSVLLVWNLSAKLLQSYAKGQCENTKILEKTRILRLLKLHGKLYTNDFCCHREIWQKRKFYHWNCYMLIPDHS